MSSKYELDKATGLLQFMCVSSLAGVTYLRYTALTSPKKGETAVRCCDPALSVHVMLVSRNVFHVVSALQFTLTESLEQAIYKSPKNDSVYLSGQAGCTDQIFLAAFHCFYSAQLIELTRLRTLIRLTRVNSCLSVSYFQHLVSYQLQCNTKRKAETANSIALKTLPWQSKHKTKTISDDDFLVKCVSFFVKLGLSHVNPSQRANVIN